MKPTVFFMLFLWRLVEFTLTLEECSKLPSVQHAFVLDEYKKTEYQKGDVIYFCCDPGFTTGLNSTYVCTENGWTPFAIGQCVADSFQLPLGCTPPPPVPNGHFLQNTTLFYENGETVGYTCDDFHLISGALTKTCTNGRWMGDIKCTLITCRVNAQPPLGTTYDPQYKTIFMPGESVTVMCGEKLRVKNSELRTALLFCQITGRWDFDPVCEQLSCPELVLPDNVLYWPVKSQFQIGQRLTFSCKSTEQLLQGLGQIRCLKGGEWNAPPPSCVDPKPNFVKKPRFLHTRTERPITIAP